MTKKVKHKANTLVNTCDLYRRKITVGDPRDSETWMGPLISTEHEQKVRSYLKIAKDEGLKFCCGETVDQLNVPAACQKVDCRIVLYCLTLIIISLLLLLL